MLLGFVAIVPHVTVSYPPRPFLYLNKKIVKMIAEEPNEMAAEIDEGQSDSMVVDKPEGIYSFIP